ncbi:6-phosphogluconolactonase [Methylocapsa palsarum]|uniref:6-phosphogluconolactonase n=1 Tax=Methylocapsa palsarum TaxID=1612308 RepID=A0A1I3Z9Y1_9HYPH|nr:6-phosphogluconolactonase [Methylocapsa palsarum]SFK40389.1 6-phosphogluconolactonase [Methylocapsa palsarum]
MIPGPFVDVAENAEEMAERAAIWLTTQAALAGERWSLNLSGGSTPKRVYELLGGAELRGRIDWRKAHLFWGDERFVPHSNPDSNYKMAFDAMIAHVPIPAAQVHAIRTDADSPQEAADLYAAALQDYYGSRSIDPERPLFDVTLLGLGDDGHTASLFPGSSALEERRAWVVSVVGVKPEPRITQTYPVLGSSRNILFLVAGAGKREILSCVLGGDLSLPAARIETAGAIRIFADKAAISAG